MIAWFFDPGKTTGYAMWDTSQSQIPVLFGEGNTKQIHEVLTHIVKPVPDIFVYENYRVRINPKQKGFSHHWDEVIPCRIIGAIELRATQLEIETVKQEASALKIGCGYAGIPYKDNTHGFYFLVKRGIIQPIGKQ